MSLLDELRNNNKELGAPNVVPNFCFDCGNKLEEVGMGWLQCEDDKCREVFLPYVDKGGNQCLMHLTTPLTKLK